MIRLQLLLALSDRLKKIKARHARELEELAVLENQASENLQQLKGLPDEQSDIENKSVVHIEDDSDTVTTNKDSDVEMLDRDAVDDEDEYQDYEKDGEEDGLVDTDDDNDVKDNVNEDVKYDDDIQADEESMGGKNNEMNDKDVYQGEDDHDGEGMDQDVGADKTGTIDVEDDKKC